MAGILDLLNGPQGKSLIEGVSKQFGLGQDKTEQAMSTALPLILGAMKNNASTSEGASGLLGALQGGKHDGGILDKLSSILGGNEVDKDVLDDGAGILGHVFGGKEENVAQAVSKSSGIDMGSAMNILKVAGPFLMGALGKQTKTNGVADQGGLSDLLGGMLGKGGGEKEQSLINRLLDADGDGSIMDDVSEMILGKGKGTESGGGLGGLLGGLFGK